MPARPNLSTSQDLRLRFLYRYTVLCENRFQLFPRRTHELSELRAGNTFAIARFRGQRYADRQEPGLSLLPKRSLARQGLKVRRPHRPDKRRLSPGPDHHARPSPLTPCDDRGGLSFYRCCLSYSLFASFFRYSSLNWRKFPCSIELLISDIKLLKK